MANVSYVCAQLQNNTCVMWVEQSNVLDTLAITPAQAGQISAAIILVLVTGWSIGELGRLIKNSNNPFG